jgi:hypothetical protein
LLCITIFYLWTIIKYISIWTIITFYSSLKIPKIYLFSFIYIKTHTILLINYFPHSKDHPLDYLFWKLNFLIEKANRKAKTTVNASTMIATSGKKSCLNPKSECI